MNSAPDTKIHPASSCSLRIEMRCGDKPLYIGTAFVVRSPVGHLLITSRQNVTGRHPDTGKLIDTRHGLVPNRMVIWHHLAHRPAEWRPVAQALVDRHDQPLWIEHPTLGARADVVAIRVPERAVGAMDPLALYPYDISSQPQSLGFAPADRVSVIGFPLDLRVAGFLPIWAAAHVASEPDADVDNLPVVLIDCRTSTGQSGAPVIATTGQDNRVRLLGVYGGRVHQQSDIGRVWKTSALFELLDAVHPFYGDVILNGSVAQSPAWLDFAGDLFHP